MRISRAADGVQSGLVDVLIMLERTEPPAGTVVPLRHRERGSEGDELPFVGWLGLLRVLAAVIGPSGEQIEGQPVG